MWVGEGGSHTYINVKLVSTHAFLGRDWVSRASKQAPFFKPPNLLLPYLLSHPSSNLLSIQSNQTPFFETQERNERVWLGTRDGDVLFFFNRRDDDDDDDDDVKVLLDETNIR